MHIVREMSPPFCLLFPLGRKSLTTPVQTCAPGSNTQADTPTPEAPELVRTPRSLSEAPSHPEGPVLGTLCEVGSNGLHAGLEIDPSPTIRARHEVDSRDLKRPRLDAQSARS